jgi:uncharacterized protein YndB with AHSA1/START domain
MTDEKKTRTYEKRIIIDADIEDVWKALTEAEEITRWFSTEANVKPGEGGEIYLAWNDDFKGSSQISVWDPPNHLQTIETREAWQASDPESPGAGTMGRPVQLSLDYHLSTEKGKTVLRLVHSGFGQGKEWDDEFDAIKRGWGTMLLNLQKYSSQYVGHQARHLWHQFKSEKSIQAYWTQLLEFFKLPAEQVSEGLEAIHPLNSGKGAVDVHLEKMELGLTFASDSQLLRFSAYDTPEGSLFWVDLLYYGDSAPSADQHFTAFTEKCNSLLGN